MFNKMTIKIQTQKTGIPVVIGELEFTFETSDQSVKKFRQNAIDIQKELNEIKIDDEENWLETSKDVLRRGYDLLLGDGAFEKVYEVTPSVMVTMQYFTQVVEGLTNELNALGYNNADKVKKYLSKK